MVMQAHCPACHAAIQVKQDQAITVCLACGKVIRIPDDLEVSGPSRAGGDGDQEENPPEAEGAQREAAHEGGGESGPGPFEAGEEDGPVPLSFVEPGAPVEDMDEDADTNEIPEPEERVDWEPPAAPQEEAASGTGTERGRGPEEAMERIPTTRFRRVERRDHVEDADLFSDIEVPSSVTPAEASSAGSMLRFETTCPSCGSLMGVEGAEVPGTLTCPQCGMQVDVAAQIAAMLGNSGLRKMLSDEEEAELRLLLERHRVASGTQGRQGGESDEAGLDEDGPVSQEPAAEDIAVVQLYCPSCRSLVSLDADLLVPGTLCPNCGRPLVPEDQEEQEKGKSRNRTGIIVASGLALSILLFVTFFPRFSPGPYPRTSVRGVPGSSSSVRGRLTMSGSLGDQVIAPTICRSGQEQGYNGVELRVGRIGTAIQLVESAEGKYVLVTRRGSVESVKLTDCDPFSLDMRRTMTKGGTQSLLEGHANLLCRDQSGSVVLQGQVWFHGCP